MAKAKKAYVAKERVDVYQEITNRIIGALENGVAPWFQPWDSAKKTGTQFIGSAFPENAKTGNRYRNLNILLLWMTAAEKGYTSNKWATYQQWQELGGHVLKDEKSTFCFKYGEFKKKVENEQGEIEEENRKYAISFRLFNLEQTSLANDERFNPHGPVEPTVIVEKPKWERRPEIDAWLEATGIELRHRGDRAFYSIDKDYVQLPHIAQFKGKNANYYSTAFHEFGHATGHPSRVGRTFGKVRGDSNYAKEELVAELVSAFLCADHGVIAEPTQDGELGKLQHAEYIGYWLGKLKDDKKFIFNAASNASKACDWLHAKAGTVTSETEEEELELAA